MKNILIIGAGYVGLGHALLFVRNKSFDITIADIDSDKIKDINSGISPIADREIEAELSKNPANLRAISADKINYADYDAVFICLPTNFDEEKNGFDTTIIDNVLSEISLKSPNIQVVIKSTIPFGYTKSSAQRFNLKNLIFAPEFLREGSALADNINPSRIVLGGDFTDEIAEIYLNVIEDPATPILKMSSSEAEAVKLFSNTYLATRIAFFNELDTFAEAKDLDAGRIIGAMGLDPRIGSLYNNPSFGYGGYCLPKDSRQLLANFGDIAPAVISATIKSNFDRKNFIAERAINSPAQVIGVYRMAMKQGSDNSREAAVWDIIERIQAEGKKVVVYEPVLTQINGLEVIDNLEDFKDRSDIILANRWDDVLEDVRHKVYTRDIFHKD